MINTLSGTKGKKVTVHSTEGQEKQKYLTFYLEKEEYGLEIHKVIEIIGELPIVSIPKIPEYIKGVINLRGRIIPVMDLRLKLGLPLKESTSETVIIIVQSKHRKMGLVIDKVTEVIDILPDNIEMTPDFGSSVESQYIKGIAKKDQSVKILLDIEKVLDLEAIEHIPKSTLEQIHENN